MRLIKLHRVLVIGGAALVASCGQSAPRKQQSSALADAADSDDAHARESGDSAADARGVDAWLSWAVEEPEAEGGTLADAADADAAPADAAGVDAWLGWV